MDGPPQRVDANIALLGAEDVGKSGKLKHAVFDQLNEKTTFKRLMDIVPKLCVSVLSAHRAVLNQKIHRRIWRYRYVFTKEHEQEYLLFHNLLLINYLNSHSLTFTESIHSHCDTIGGREICFNIWDSVCPQVSLGSSLQNEH